MARRMLGGGDNPSIDGGDAAPGGSVPWPLVITAAYAWRIIVIGIVLAGIGVALARLTPIVLPLVIAVLIAAPLERLVTRMARHRVPRGLGAAIVILALNAIVWGLIVIAGSTVVAGFDELRQAALEGFHQLLTWLTTGPLNIEAARLDDITGQLSTLLEQNWQGVASGAITVTGTIGSVLAGALISLVALFFFLRDGREM